MSSIYGINEIIINLFTIMFGGKVSVNADFGPFELGEVVIGPSIPLIVSFALFIGAFVLLLLILVGYYSRELKKGTLTVLSVVTICLLITASAITLLSAKFGKASLVEVTAPMVSSQSQSLGEEYQLTIPEAAEQLNAMFNAKLGADAIIVSTCGFCAAIATLVSLLGLHLRKAEPVAIK